MQVILDFLLLLIYCHVMKCDHADNKELAKGLLMLAQENVDFPVTFSLLVESAKRLIDVPLVVYDDEYHDDSKCHECGGVGTHTELCTYYDGG
jgi:hypothetical protein